MELGKIRPGRFFPKSYVDIGQYCIHVRNCILKESSTKKNTKDAYVSENTWCLVSGP